MQTEFLTPLLSNGAANYTLCLSNFKNVNTGSFQKKYKQDEYTINKHHFKLIGSLGILQIYSQEYWEKKKKRYYQS